MANINNTNTINDFIPQDKSNAPSQGGISNIPHSQPTTEQGPTNTFVSPAYTPPTNIDSHEWDVVLTFFKSSMLDPIAAEHLTQQIFRVADQSAVPVLDIIDSMKGQSGIELTASISYYLNGIRSNSAMLGIENIVKPNYYAGRCVLT